MTAQELILYLLNLSKEQHLTLNNIYLNINGYSKISKLVFNSITDTVQIEEG